MGKPFMELFRSEMDYDAAREKGRHRAAMAILHDPETRERMEKAYTVEGCMKQYPEAYGLENKPEYVLP